MAFANLRAIDRWLSAISAILLAGYFAFCLYALAQPSDDPQKGMAVGFLVFVEVILLCLGWALWLGVSRTRAWLVRTVSFFAIFPAISQIAQEIFLFFHRGY